MPVDSLGNRADVITDSMSTISRMNLGRSYQSYLCAVARDNKHILQNHFIAKYGKNFLSKINKEDLQFAHSYLRGLYSLINPDMVEFIDSLNEEELLNHLTEVVTKELYLYYPPDNEINVTDVISNIENSVYKPHNGKVSYIDEFNRKVTTKEDVRIGQLYFMVLEKIANSYSAVSSSKANNFGFPVKGTNLDKFKYPHSLTPTKTLGETEVRILTSFSPPETVADLVDITLNPISHKLLIKNILESKVPFDTNYNIDRSKVPYGQTKSLMILKHMFNASGFDIDYEEQTP